MLPQTFDVCKTAEGDHHAGPCHAFYSHCAGVPGVVKRVVNITLLLLQLWQWWYCQGQDYSGKKIGAAVGTCILLLAIGVLILLVVRTKHIWLPQIIMVSHKLLSFLALTNSCWQFSIAYLKLKHEILVLQVATCLHKTAFAGFFAASSNKTRKPCYRKETARCRSCSFRFKVRRQHSLQVFTARCT